MSSDLRLDQRTSNTITSAVEKASSAACRPKQVPQKIFSEEELLIETESDYIHNEELEHIMADKSGEDIDKED